MKKYALIDKIKNKTMEYRTNFLFSCNCLKNSRENFLKLNKTNISDHANTYNEPPNRNPAINNPKIFRLINQSKLNGKTGPKAINNFASPPAKTRE